MNSFLVLLCDLLELHFFPFKLILLRANSVGSSLLIIRKSPLLSCFEWEDGSTSVIWSVDCNPSGCLSATCFPSQHFSYLYLWKNKGKTIGNSYSRCIRVIGPPSLVIWLWFGSSQEHLLLRSFSFKYTHCPFYG